MSREDLEIRSPDDVIALLAPIMERIANLAADRVISNGGPRPAEGPYVWLDWSEITVMPQNHGDYDDEDPPSRLFQTLRNECEGVIRIGFYGERAFDAAVMAWGWLDSDQRVFDLWKEPLGYGGIEKIRSRPEKRGAAEQPRAYFDLKLNLAFESVYPVDFFESSQWQLTEYSGHGETPRVENHVYPETTL